MELAVVIMIVGMLISILASTDLKKLILPSSSDSSEAFAEILRFSYKTARIRHQTLLVNLDLEKNIYSLEALSREDGAIKKRFLVKEKEFPYGLILMKVIDNRGTVFEKTKMEVPFTPDGVSEDYSFQIGNGEVVQKTVILKKYGGKVEIKSGEFAYLSEETPKIDYGLDWRDEEKKTEESNR